MTTPRKVRLSKPVLGNDGYLQPVTVPPGEYEVNDQVDTTIELLVGEDGRGDDIMAEIDLYAEGVEVIER